MFHQSPVIYFSFQLKLVKCAEDLYFWEHLIKLRSRFPSLASFPFVADPPSEDARWDSSNEGDEERGFKAVLTDTMSRRWATVSSWMFLVGSHCVVVVVVVVQMRRVCDHRPTTRRRQLSSQTWRRNGKWDEVVCRYQQSVHTWREHSADSAHSISWSQIRSNKHAVGLSLDRLNSNSRSWTRWRWGWRRCQWWRGVNITSSGPDRRLLSNIFLLSVFFVFFIDLNVSINKIFRSCS